MKSVTESIRGVKPVGLNLTKRRGSGKRLVMYSTIWSWSLIKYRLESTKDKRFTNSLATGEKYKGEASGAVEMG